MASIFLNELMMLPIEFSMVPCLKFSFNISLSRLISSVFLSILSYSNGNHKFKATLDSISFHHSITSQLLQLTEPDADPSDEIVRLLSITHSQHPSLRDSPIDSLIELCHYEPIEPATAPLRRRYPDSTRMVRIMKDNHWTESSPLSWHAWRISRRFCYLRKYSCFLAL